MGINYQQHSLTCWVKYLLIYIVGEIRVRGPVIVLVSSDVIEVFTFVTLFLGLYGSNISA